MYIFDLWFAGSRRAIAKAELDAAWAVERAAMMAKYPSQHHAIAEAFDARYPAVLSKITHNIHPLCILGLRRKIK